LITAFGDRVGEQIADRWLALVLAPGTAFSVAVVLAAALGQGHAVDPGPIGLDGRRLFAGYGDGAGTLVVLAVALASSATFAATFARAFARAVAWIWEGGAQQTVLWPLRILTLRRWLRAHRRLQAAYKAARDPRGSINRSDPDVKKAQRRRDRIAAYRPSHATWIGNRLAAMYINIKISRGVDLKERWPRLWITLPDRLREDIVAARDTFDDAAVLTAWGLMYLALGAAWWPAAVGGIVFTWRGWAAGRSAAEAYASLVEAAVQVHLPARPGNDPGPG
jgi:hypothetical protein